MNQNLPVTFSDSTEVTTLPDKTAQRWQLTGQISETEPVREYQIHEGNFSVGRRSDSSLCLPVGSVSKNHAIIDCRGDRLSITDLHSTNGTFVNGQPIGKVTQLNDGDLIQFASIVFRLSRNNHTTEHQTLQQDHCDHALALIQFDRLFESGAFVPHFHPIVAMKDQSRVGFEVLGRSRIFGLKTAEGMFQAASQLDLECKLSDLFRNRGIEESRRLQDLDINIFVNTHPKELGSEGLYQNLYNLREKTDQTITLEIHERAATDSQIMGRLSAILKELDIKLAFDDFGVGQARLAELGEYRPDFLKFDMQLTRGVDTAPPKRLELVSLLCKLSLDLGIAPLAEGIENEASHEILREMGFTFGQGFYYGKPEPISKYL